VFRECAKHVGRNEDKRVVEVPDDDYVTVVSSGPVGVCALISPWNYSLLMPVWKVAPALATGCSVVLKPSELTPIAALELAQIAHEAGVPPGVLNVLPGAGETGGILSRHPLVRKVSFTGSCATGRKVMEACSNRAANCTLELGGKSPIIVFDDVDIDPCVEWIMFGIFNNQGQVCSATSRLLVQRGVAPKLLARLAECAAAIAVGPGDHPDTRVGPIVSRGQFDKVMAFIAEARGDPKIRVLAGGGPPAQLAGGAAPSSGLFVAPTVLADVPPSARVWREEVFGPVLACAEFATEAEAIARANAGEFGLAGAVMSADAARCERVADALDVGVCWINCSQPAFCTAPWGGTKQSGIGRELGTWGIEAFQEIKQVTRAKDATKQVGFFTMARL
jgi:betaine-aldehyde dehydrogenase